MTKRARGAAAHTRGVTLVEVLIVVAIMALISGGIGIMVMNHWKDAQIKTTRTRAQALRSAVTLYATLGPGGCPTANALAEAGHLEPDNVVDAWGHPFSVECEERRIWIRSAGPDGTENTTDDIVVPASLPGAAGVPSS